MPDYHSMSIDDALSKLSATRSGLAEEEAKKRLGEYGPNELIEKKGTSALGTLVEQFKDFLIILLIAAAVISAAIGIHEGSIEEIVEAALVIIIVLFIVIVGFYQEYNAKKELEALKKMVSPHANVLRDGNVVEVPAKELVVGDVVIIDSGDKIPADMRIIEASELRIDESSLTGESTPVDKEAEKIKEVVALADRTNMLYMATTAVYGKGKAVVTATGMQTQLGKIAGDISEIEEEKTPLQNRLNKLGKQIGAVVIAISAIILIVGMFTQGTPFQDMLLIAIALAVAAVPEGLPGVVTVALATGVRKMVKENAIIRKLPAVETLGSTTVICSDKTGTLTKNEMTIRKVWTPKDIYDVGGEGYSEVGEFRDRAGNEASGADIDELFACGALVCDAEVGKDHISGDPTEAAVIVAASKAGIDAKNIKESMEFMGEIPFSSERKRKTKIYDGTAFSMGAPDVFLESCTKILAFGKERKLTKKDKEEIRAAIDNMANQALRTLAFAKKKGRAADSTEGAEEDMTFLGLVGMIDPPRPESKEAVEKCKEAGIRVVMITGDHKLTAKAIARELEIYKEGDGVLTGPELEGMDEDELADYVDKVSVYARVSPSHKLKIIDALQKRGNVVAMTGDGVNDAPALKKADIGVAMGIMGTDVSKEAADMVLTDDNFSSIVKAVEQGRGIYDNIRKFFAYLISGNIAEVAVIFMTALVPGIPIALSASQILIINLVTDGLPALALSVDPFEPGAMKRKPRPKKEPLYKGLSHFLIGYPLIAIIVTMGLFLWIWDPMKQNIFEAQTVAFLSIAFFELYQAFSARSTRYPALKVGLFKNKYLVAAAVGSLLTILTLIYVPIDLGAELSLQELTHLTPIDLSLLAGIAAISSLGFIYLEIAKWRNSKSDKS